MFVVESLDENLWFADSETELDVETTRGHDDRTRARIHEAVGDSPLVIWTADWAPWQSVHGRSSAHS